MQVMNLTFNYKQICYCQPFNCNQEYITVHVARVPNDCNLIKNEYFSVLSENERKKALAFRFLEDRNSYITAHVLLRTSLSSHFRVSPNDWIFRNSQLGKPEQVNLPNKAYFNLSRRREMVCCALSRSPVGVDIESFNALENCNDFISVLHSKEADDIRYLPESKKRLYAVIYWTLKESLLKGTGEGIGGLLNNFWFSISKNDKRIEIQDGDLQNRNLKRWKFATFFIDRSHVISVSIHPKNNVPLILIDYPMTELFGASEDVKVNIKNYVCK